MTSSWKYFLTLACPRRYGRLVAWQRVVYGGDKVITPLCINQFAGIKVRFFSSVYKPAERSDLKWRASGSKTASQRQYSQPSWLWPLGKIDHPQKKDFKEPAVSALVQLSEPDAQSVAYLERLHDASSPEEVLEILQDGRRDLTAVHYGRALCRLADIYHGERQELGVVKSTTAPVLYDTRFRHLCHTILQQSRHMDNDTYLEVLDALHRIGVPLKSSMIYTFLVQGEQRINSFKAAELARFAGVLSRFGQHNPRVGALMSAVGILTPRNINHLRTTRQVLILIDAVGHTLDGVSRGKLANMLLATLAADEERTLDDIVHAVLALHKMHYKLDILLELVCPVLMQNMHKLSDHDLHSLLCALGGLQHPNRDFFQTASERVLESLDNWKVGWLINVMEAFSAVRIQAPVLYDCIIKKVMANKTEDVTVTSFTKLIKSLVDLGHRPPSSWNFEQFVAGVSSSLISQVSSDDCRSVITLAKSLAELGYDPEDLLDFLASRQFANWIMMVKDGREYKSMMSDIRSLILLFGDCKQDRAQTWTDSMHKLLSLH